MEAPVHYLDRADIFTVTQNQKSAKKVSKKAAPRKKRFNPREEVKDIQMCRIKNSDPVSYEVSPKAEENVSFEQLQKSVQELILKSKDSKKSFKRTKARSVAFAVDERGHFMPKEKEHMLSAQEMKEKQKLINDLSESVHNSYNSEKIQSTCQLFQSVFDNLTENVFDDIIEDYSARCPFVGKLLSNLLNLLSFMFSSANKMLTDLDKSSKAAMRQSVSDLELFKQKVTELRNRPPVVVEKEVIIEKKQQNTILDKTKELEQELKINEAHMKRMKYDKDLAVSAKEVWKSCAIELCKLSAPQTVVLQQKQEKWTKSGQNYIDKIRDRTKEIVRCSKQLSEHWNEKAVVVFSLCCKAQTSVLLHFKMIADKCATYSQKIIRDYDTIMLDPLHDSTSAYTKFMIDDGELRRMSNDFQAWGPAIEEWADLENTVNVLEARTTSFSLNSDMAMLINALESYVYKNSIPADIVPQLKSYLQRMERVSDVLTKPYSEQARIALTPLVKQIRDIAAQTKLALEGKPCKYMTVAGDVDSLEIRAISFKLSSFGKILDAFVNEKTELLHQTQTMIPELTYDIMGVSTKVITPIENNILFLQQELDENSEIAQAWAIMYGSGSQGPFKLVSQKSIGLDFVSSYGAKMKKWIDEIKNGFDVILSDGSFEEFELLLHDWFDTAEKLIHGASVFFYSAETQTDPVIVADTSIETLKNQLTPSSSEDSFVMPLQKMESQVNMKYAKMAFTDNFLLFEQDPNFHIQKKRVETRTQSFSKIKTTIVTPESPIQPSKPIPNAHPQSWLYKIMKEFISYRVANSVSFKRGALTYYISNVSVADAIRDFAAQKSGKKTQRDFLKQISDAFTNSKSDTDPLLYVIKLCRSGVWCRSTFDFFVSLYKNINERTQFNPLTFAEEIFSPFGYSPVNSARSVVSIFTPTNADEVVYALSYCFECILKAKQCESLSLYRKFATKSGIQKDMFKGLASHLQTTNPLPDTNLMIDSFYQSSSALQESDFRVLCLFCGIFGSSGVLVAADPFGLYQDEKLDEIRNAITSCDFLSATKIMSNSLNYFIEKAKLDSFASSECAFSLAHTIRVCCRCIDGSTSSTTFITSSNLPLNTENESHLISPLSN